MVTLDKLLWVEKYRPRKIADCIIPKKNKSILEGYVKNRSSQNLILASTAPGTGKTSAARAIASELGYDTLFINASLENGIDVLRTKIQSFCSSVSMTGDMKCVVMDEADFMNAQSLQPAMRAFIERFSSNVRFIFTCNYINKLIDPIVSRCTVIDFNIPPEERNDIAKQITARCCDILRAEGVEFDVKAVVKVISLYFPDFRRVLNELQRYAVGGTIDMGILTGLNQGKYDTLLKAVGTKNFKVMREWVGNNKDVDTQRLFTWMFNHAEEFLIPQSVPELILILADYQHRAAFVADQEINLSAALTEMMMKLKFKE